ncbi:hypothetical protein SGR_7011 [Streptomyces griseus subsp. griseus NBRC 13350]|uniref:Uncharacterized protein n=1 Tax=Streptomyces griseus subsp. griseus (strain JCM 4626 / CBS 651.72 / NBRC 13350 / KCC S-0626 / ISP 5235) TaxID=455632 RepID=B1VPT8_STRGG|nr:hypothetical protein [Streptomyces griseus]BAG23838.1 hypothetical protein SGR_7011 [Streptomyces griseus subsp. griseus NBRC 13350]
MRARHCDFEYPVHYFLRMIVRRHRLPLPVKGWSPVAALIVFAVVVLAHLVGGQHTAAAHSDLPAVAASTWSYEQQMASNVCEPLHEHPAHEVHGHQVDRPRAAPFGHHDPSASDDVPSLPASSHAGVHFDRSGPRVTAGWPSAGMAAPTHALLCIWRQ